MKKTIIFSLLLTFNVSNCFSIGGLFRNKKQICYPTIEIKNKTTFDLDIEAKTKNEKIITIPKRLCAQKSFMININNVEELLVGHRIYPGCFNPGFFDGHDLIGIVKQEIEAIEQLYLNSKEKRSYKITVYLVKNQFTDGYSVEVKLDNNISN